MLGVLILSSSLVLGLRGLWKEAEQTGGELREKDKYRELVRWLDRKAALNPGDFSVVMDAYLLQRNRWRTRPSFGYHWLAGHSTYEDLLAMTDQLGARYVVFRPQARTGFQVFTVDQCRLDHDFRLSKDSPSGELVYERIGQEADGERTWDWNPPVSDPGTCTGSAFLARKTKPANDKSDADETP